jgi:hypothetical protein
VDEAGLGSYPEADSGINGVEIPCSATRVSVK